MTCWWAQRRWRMATHWLRSIGASSHECLGWSYVRGRAREGLPLPLDVSTRTRAFGLPSGSQRRERRPDVELGAVYCYLRRSCVSPWLDRVKCDRAALAVATPPPAAHASTGLPSPHATSNNPLHRGHRMLGGCPSNGARARQPGQTA